MLHQRANDRRRIGGELTDRDSQGIAGELNGRELEGPAGELTDQELEAIAGGGKVYYLPPPRFLLILV